MKFLRAIISFAAAVLLFEGIALQAFAAISDEAYKICSDIVYTYKTDQSEGREEIRQLLSKLKSVDPSLGETWQSIMNYWEFINNDFEVVPEVIPDGLPNDGSLCIVVLGFQLKEDGSMTEELEGRCEAALKSAEKYPNTLVAVTGGGTARRNPEATEADSMAAWLISRGISEDRIVVENRSKTTVENAKFTCSILSENHPEVKMLAVVSSDYHLPEGCLMFSTQMRFEAWQNEFDAPVVCANAAYVTEENFRYETVSGQAFEIWSLFDSIRDEMNESYS